ncbi:MAG: BTAD domain-containing putative transcriptional regulator [Rubrivivax sp.]
MEPNGDIRIQVLGPVRIVDRAPALGPKQQLLLGALALRHGTLSSDELAELLWQEREPRDARAALQVHISKLRSVLAPFGGSVRREGDGYALSGFDGRIDALRFERLAKRGHELLASNPHGACAKFAEALDLWHGEPVSGLATDTTLQGEVARLMDLRLAAVRGRIEADIALGRYETAVSELRLRTRENPLHEGFWHQLMVALAGAGRVAEALAAFDAARRALRDELGTDPGPPLRELHRMLLHQDPAVMPSRSRSAQTPIAPAPDSVVVLPFEVIGERDHAELLANGLHMDLLTELSRVPRLTVISRHSALAYAESELRLDEIAAQLGVAMVVTGSVQVDGGRFRLTVHLVDAATGTQRWAESYDNELSTRSVLSVQRDLALDIAGSLARRALPREVPTTSNIEAYRLVIEGRMQFDRKTEQSLGAAVDCFQRAVLADPDYGAAWAGLADALAMSADYGYGDQMSLVSSAEAAVTRALTMSTDAAMVHASRGLIAESRRDAKFALAEYEQALREAPGHADAHSWHAWVSLVTGRAEQGLVSARRSVELNPLSAEAVTNLALAHLAAQNPQSALDEARRATALSPTYTTSLYYEGIALYDLGRVEDAVGVLTPLSVGVAGKLTTPWAGMAPHAALALALLASGSIDAARDVLATIDRRDYPVEAGLVHLGLGEIDAARELFDSDVPLGYGACLLLHHHFRGTWALLSDDAVRRRLLRHAARSWNSEPPAGAAG